jgi:peroxiredoxin
MNQNTWRPVAAIATLVMFAGCQEGTKSQPLVAAVTADTKSPVVASDNSKTSVQQPATGETKSSPKTADRESARPKTRTAFYRANAKSTTIPKVLMSKADVAVCKVKVGDIMPTIELPKPDGTTKTKLSDLYGKNATVVIFWKGDRRMSQQQLADIGADIVEPFRNVGVAVVGVAVDKSNKDAEAAIKKSGATFPNLHDADGKAFAQVGNGRFPRTYVLDAGGKIVWFDIEYSLATRRELHQALEAITGGK